VVALVDDEAVVGEHLVGAVASGEALDHGHVDDPGRLVLASADGADLVIGEIEVLAEPVAPLG
jgi:hypothetical protein